MSCFLRTVQREDKGEGGEMRMFGAFGPLVALSDTSLTPLGDPER